MSIFFKTMSSSPSRSKARRGPITLDAIPVHEEELTAAQFLRLAKENPGLIKSSSAVMPTPGKPGFGKILVRYLHPIYKTKSA